MSERNSLNKITNENNLAQGEHPASPILSFIHNGIPIEVRRTLFNGRLLDGNLQQGSYGTILEAHRLDQGDREKLGFFTGTWKVDKNGGQTFVVTQSENTSKNKASKEDYVPGIQTNVARSVILTGIRWESMVTIGLSKFAVAMYEKLLDDPGIDGERPNGINKFKYILYKREG